MNNYHLYDTATGILESSASEMLDSIPDGKAVKVSDKTGVWNKQTLDFDPIREDKKLSTLEFMSLLTDDELVTILDAAKMNTSIQLFVMKMEQAEFMNLNHQSTVDGVNALEEAGLLAQGRAEVILNG